MLDITALLAPVSEELPAGVDLRATGNNTYLQLREARLAARQQEYEALRSEEPAVKDLRHWHTIIELAPGTLQRSSKDLTVACWLIEALTRVEGFKGLQLGLELLHGLVEAYWEDFYPQLDEEGVATRLAPFVGLNGEYSEGTLITPVNSIVLTKGNRFSVAAWQYQQSLNYASATTDSNVSHATSEDFLTLDKIKEAVLETPRAHLDEMQATIENCLSRYKALTTLLSERCESQYNLPTSNIQQALTFNLETVQAFQRMLQPLNQPASREATQEGEPHAIAQTISSKQQAFNSLLEIAEFFRQHEPQSPVPYLLEQAVRWGNLPLPDLLAQLVPDPRVLGFSLQLLGAKNNYQQASDGERYEEN
jgi:type VI secretion system protein ImpA